MTASILRNTRVVVVGISGPSASGKTTLTRLLKDVFQDVESGENASGSREEKSSCKIRVSVLHQDDFYVADEKVPIRPFFNPVTKRDDTVDDWDCAEAIDYEHLASTVTYFRDHAKLPGGLRDWVEKEEVARAATKLAENESHGDSEEVKDVREDEKAKEKNKGDDVEEQAVQEFRKDIQLWLASLKLSGDRHSTSLPSSSPSKLQHTDISILLLEGFLLYPPNPSLLPSSLFTTRLFLPLPPSPRGLTTLLARRSTRTGYSTSSGLTWVDPPGYAEGVVWRNYIRDQGRLFNEGGQWKGERGIECAPGKGESGMPMVLEWAVGKVREAVERGGLIGVAA